MVGVKTVYVKDQYTNLGIFICNTFKHFSDWVGKISSLGGQLPNTFSRGPADGPRPQGEQGAQETGLGPKNSPGASVAPLPSKTAKWANGFQRKR